MKDQLQASIRSLNIDDYSNKFAPACIIASSTVGKPYYSCRMFIEFYSSTSSLFSEDNAKTTCKNVLEVTRNYANEIGGISIMDFSLPTENSSYTRTKINIHNLTPVEINKYCTSCAKIDGGRCEMMVSFTTITNFLNL